MTITAESMAGKQAGRQDGVKARAERVHLDPQAQGRKRGWEWRGV